MNAKDRKQIMKKNIYWIAVGLCLLVIVWKLISIIGYSREYHQSDRVYEQLAAMTAEEPVVTSFKKDGEPEPPGSEKLSIPSETLKQINPDYVGWLLLPGTGIDYPVVQGKDNAYYLDHLFDGTKNKAGCLFLDAENDSDFSSRNSIIYGHYMKNKSMFYELSSYKEQSWWKVHPEFQLILPDRQARLVVFSAYVADVSENAWQMDFESQEAYENWVRERKERSLFQPDQEIGIPNAVVTCSTCSYEFENARFVVHMAVYWDNETK